MTLLKALLSFRGRIGCAAFWGIAIAVLALTFVIIPVAGSTLSGPLVPLIIVGWLVIASCLWLAACALRLHDVGRSGWLASAPCCRSWDLPSSSGLVSPVRSPGRTTMGQKQSSSAVAGRAVGAWGVARYLAWCSRSA